jgi:hypothetical protein
MDLTAWRRRATEKASAWRDASGVAAKSLNKSLAGGINTTASMAGEVYTAALDWKSNSEFSRWLTDQFSNQHSTIASKAMDVESFRTHIGGNWHRLYDGGHSLTGSWNAIGEALPDLTALDRLSIWANEYWKDLITTRGMPIIILDHADQVSEYFKHLDCVNVAQLIGGEVCGVSIYCNWNDPAKLLASTAAMDCSAIVYANVIAPMVSLIALGRAYFLLKRSEQNELEHLIVPALKGLSRSGATILLITIIPGGFLLHLGSGIIISVAHGYVWDKGSENKEAILKSIKMCLEILEKLPEQVPPLTRLQRRVTKVADQEL